MAMMRMNMGQKHAAKTMTKVAFAESGETTEVRSHGRASVTSMLSSSSANLAQKSDASMSEVQVSTSHRGSMQSEKGLGTMASVASGGSKEYKDGTVTAQTSDTRRGSVGLDSMDMTMESPWPRRFNLIMGVLIILNTILIAVETDFGYDESGTAGLEDKIGWVVLDVVFILIFLFEIAVRLHWEGIRHWVRSMWNWVDVVIVGIAVMDLSILTALSGDRGNFHYFTIFRIIRLIRLVRLVKLVRLLHGLYVILMAFWHAMKTMSFLLAMMLFGLMIYAIMAVNLIGRNSALKGVRIGTDTVSDRFGTVYKSMYSLFELMTLEGWEQVARPIVEEQPALFLFIVSFIMIFTFGMLNMVVALVIDKTLHHTRLLGEDVLRNERTQMAQELQRIHEHFSDENKGAEGCITLQEFETSLCESECIQRILDRMGVMPKEARELYTVLDWDESGELTIDELLEGLSKLQEGVCSAWDSMATHSNTRSTRIKLAALEESIARIAKEQERLHSTLTDQQRWLARIETGMDQHTELLHCILAGLKIPCPPGLAANRPSATSRQPTTDRNLSTDTQRSIVDVSPPLWPDSAQGHISPRYRAASLPGACPTPPS